MATTKILADNIARVYSGLPGCGCGCTGKYWEDARNIKRIVKIMNSRLDETVDDGGIFALENDTRYYWAYSKPA